MRKGSWIALSLALLLISLFFGMAYRKLKVNPFSGRIPIRGVENVQSLPVKDSLLTLLIYFSHRSGEENMREAFYWNKLYKEIPRKDLFILGIIPGNEDIGNLRNKFNIAFPIGWDENLIVARNMLISFTPFRIIMDQNGKVLLMSPNVSQEESQKDFYFQVIELLKKTHEVQFQKDWPKNLP